MSSQRSFSMKYRHCYTINHRIHYKVLHLTLRSHKNQSSCSSPPLSSLTRFSSLNHPFVTYGFKCQTVNVCNFLLEYSSFSHLIHTTPYGSSLEVFSAHLCLSSIEQNVQFSLDWWTSQGLSKRNNNQTSTHYYYICPISKIISQQYSEDSSGKAV